MLHSHLYSTSSKLIVIDDPYNRSTAIVREIVEKGIHNQQNIVIYGYNDNFRNFADDNKSVTYIHAKLDPWEGEGKSELCTIVKDKCVVVIDSIDHFVMDFGLSKCLKQIKELTCRNFIKVVCIKYLRDGHDEKLSECLKYLSNLYVTINCDNVVNYSFRKEIGKPLKKTEKMTLNENYATFEEIKTPKIMTPTLEIVNPENLTTFKIGLKDDEKISRDQVVLPYLRNNIAREVSGSGQIIYYPDENDDLDEEDPDDDLNI